VEGKRNKSYILSLSVSIEDSFPPFQAALLFYLSARSFDPNQSGIGFEGKRSSASATPQWPRPRISRRPLRRSNPASGPIATSTTTRRPRPRPGTGRAPSGWRPGRQENPARRPTPGRNRDTLTAVRPVSEVSNSVFNFFKYNFIFLPPKTEISY